MDYIRLYEKHHLESLLKLNEIVQDEFEDYPYHANWMDKARDDIELGKRIAFGAVYGNELVGSVIVKDGLSSDLELKNFIVNKNVPEINIEEVRDNLLNQVEIFAQRNDYEIFTIDILTKHLEDLNYFLSRNFTVSYLKQFPNKNSISIYTLTKDLKTIYNGDPLDFQMITDWILRRQFNFNIEKVTKLKEPLGPIANCFKYTFTLKNSLKIKEFSIKGEAMSVEFIDEIDIQPNKVLEILSSYFESSNDIRFIFDSRKLKDPIKFSNVNYISKSGILEILGKESIPVKIPFTKNELGGALFYVDKKIKMMYFPESPGLFPENKIRIYLVDGYGSSLNNGDTVFFVEKQKNESLRLLAKADISATYLGNYDKIYTNLRGANKNQFLKSQKAFQDSTDSYKKPYWDFLTSFQRTSKNRKNNTIFIIALALNNFVKLENDGVEFLNILTKLNRDFIDSDKRESFTGITYLNKYSVETLKRKYFKLNDVIDNSKDSSSKLGFSNPN